MGEVGSGGAASERALARAHRVTQDIADDLLTHLPDLGDPIVQRALDAWVEQAADTMRAVGEALEERLLGAGRTQPSTRVPTSDGPVPRRGRD